MKKIADVDDEAMEIIIIKKNWMRYKGGIYTESVIQLHMCSLSHICGFICDPNQTRLSFKEYLYVAVFLHNCTGGEYQVENVTMLYEKVYKVPIFVVST